MATRNTERSQYHHYIPRFVLKNFIEPDTNRTKEAQKFHKIRVGDGLIRYYDVDEGNLGFRPISTAYGVNDMYRDAKLEDTLYIEKELSKLEGRAARVIKKLLRAQADNQRTLTLPSKDLYTLRRFLYVMQYRTPVIRERYQCSIEDYEGADKDELNEYMEKRGFQHPNDVWLETLRLVLDAPYLATGNSYDELKEKMYDADYAELKHNLDDFFICICEPDRAENEFIITDTGFSVCEGLDLPADCEIPPMFPQLTRMLYTKRDRFISFHKIAVISPRLAIVLRHILWNGQPHNLEMKNLLSNVLGPSMFDDLPVRAAIPNYANLQNPDGTVRTVTSPSEVEYSWEDNYELGIYPIPNKDIMFLNTMQIDKAQEAITFSSDNAMRASIMHHLNNSREPIRLSVFEADTTIGREPYRLLERRRLSMGRLAMKAQLFALLDEETINKNPANVPEMLVRLANAAKKVRQMVQDTNYIMLAQGSIDMFTWDLQMAQDAENKRAKIASLKDTLPEETVKQKMEDHNRYCLTELNIRAFLMSIRLTHSLKAHVNWLAPTEAEKCVFKLWGNPKVSETEFRRLLYSALWKENYRKLACQGVKQKIGIANKEQYPFQMVKMEMYAADEYGSAIEWATRNNFLEALEVIRGQLCDIGLCEWSKTNRASEVEMTFRKFLCVALLFLSGRAGAVTISDRIGHLFEKDMPWRELLSVWLFPLVDREWCEARWNDKNQSMSDMSVIMQKLDNVIGLGQ